MSFVEVVVRHRTSSRYNLKVFVDGKEAEPGLHVRLHGDGTSVVQGFVERSGDVHAFVFGKTPVDERAAVADRVAECEIGEVSRAEIFVTRRARRDDSSSEEEWCDGQGHSSDSLAFSATDSATSGSTVLPEGQAVNELGAQVRAGSTVGRLYVLEVQITKPYNQQLPRSAWAFATVFGSISGAAQELLPP